MKRSTYSIIYYFLKPCKLLYVVILLVTVVVSALESFSLAAFFPIFSSLLGEPAGNSMGNAGGILDAITKVVGILPFDDPVISATVFLIGLFLIKTVLTLVRVGLTSYASAKVLYRIKNQIMERLATSHYQFFLDQKQGTLIYNSLTAPNRLGQLLNLIPQMVADTLKISSIAIVLAFVSLEATVVVAILGIGYLAVVQYLSAAVSYKLGTRRTRANTNQTIIANEFFSGIRQIIAYGTAERWLRDFRQENRNFSEAFARHMLWLDLPRSVLDLTGILLIGGMLLMLRISDQTTFVDSISRLGIFAVATVQILPSIIKLGRMRMDMMGTLPDAERVYSSLTGTVQTRSDGSKTLESFGQAITFEDVSFAHKSRETLLKGVDITLEKGKMTAIVGSSGAGKTTIINLILRLFEPTGGRITVDGIPIEEYRLDSWLHRIGLVSQDPFVYHSTVTDNIAFGRQGYSSQSIKEAAKIANAHGFISELPQGYDTVVGEMGMKLSGGQQQRIAIARSVLSKPDILIFDEATSSLDTHSEKLVQEAIDNVSKDCTVIIIAHRISTVRNADKIIVLEEGRVIEEGDHQELLQRQGYYSHLVTSSS